MPGKNEGEHPCDDAPLYIVFAGINGAGKSTLYRSGLWRMSAAGLDLERINPDEILKENGDDPADVRAQMKAGREAVRRIGACLDARRSFNQETTLSGRSSVRTIERAHKLGYRIALYYIGVESIEVARRRIAHRVELGGHDIALDTVERRFDRSEENLLRAIPLCNEAYLFDNTLMLQHIGTVRQGKVEANEYGLVAGWAQRLIERIEEILEARPDAPSAV